MQRDLPGDPLPDGLSGRGPSAPGSVRRSGVVRRVGVVCAAIAACALATEARATGADGRFEERTSSHFVLLQDVDIDDRHGFRGSRRFEQQVLKVLEGAYRELEARLGLRPRRPITVVIDDPAIFDQRFAGLFRFAAAGFYAGTIRIRGDVVVNDRLVRVLYHELVHAAFDAEAPSLVLPAWMNEGVAEWFEARAIGKRLLHGGEWAALERVVRAGGWIPLSALSAPSFARMDGRTAHQAYLQSYGFVDFLVRQAGERALRRWCVEVLRTGDVNRTFRRVYRGDVAKLEAKFVAELSGRR